jgi:hypothetical protein
MDGKLHSERGRDIIDLNNADHVAQWTEIFNVTRADLAAAIQAVGARSSDVKRYLRELRACGRTDESQSRHQ